VLAAIKMRPGSSERGASLEQRPTLTASARAGKRAAIGWDDRVADGSNPGLALLCIGTMT